MKANFSSQVAAIASTYATDTIFILGKGPSVNEVPLDIFSGSLVIGINDAERIYPADITLFHDEWVAESLKKSGPKARLYLTSTSFRASNTNTLQLPYVPLTQESADLMIQRLLGQDIVIEDVLFLTALRVAREIATLRGRAQKVYMIGFDFQPELGFAEVSGNRFRVNEVADQARRISMQENYFLNALYMLQDGVLDVKHIGNRSFSQMTAAELAEAFHKDLKSTTSKRDWKVIVTAELTTNHFGSRNRLERMVRAAHSAGADFIKVQKRDVDTFYTSEQLKAPYRSPFGKSFADYRHQLELSGEDFEFLSRLCSQLDIQWFASVLDKKSYDFVSDFNPPLMKLPSTISEHRDYLKHVADKSEYGIVLSTGMTDRAYEGWVIETFKKVPQLYLMQANSAYPTPSQDCNVGVVRHYDRLSKLDPRIIPAFSSHDEGWFGSAMAIGAGARMVEKHVKFGNTDWAHFDAVALDLTTSQFRDYVEKMREAEIVVGSENKAIAKSEHHKYRRKSG